MLERRTGDSRNEVGLNPGGILIQVDLEIGSFAGDMSLYLAPAAAPPESAESRLVSGSTRNSSLRLEETSGSISDKSFEIKVWSLKCEDILLSVRETKEVDLLTSESN